MTAGRFWLLVALLAYTPAVILPHESVQSWLGRMIAPVGLRRFYALAAAGGAIALAASSVWLWRALVRHAARGTILALWAVTVALMIAAWQLLSVNNTELVHFPQYAVTGLLLLTLTRSVADALAWTTIAGGLDEAYQYAVLHPGWGIPYDFNDVYLDLLGGAAGCLLAASFFTAHRRLPPAGWSFFLRRSGVIALALLLAAGLALFATGKLVLYEDQGRGHWVALSRLRPQGFWFFDATWGPRRIHTLEPLEGIALIGCTLAAYAIVDRRYRLSP